VEKLGLPTVLLISTPFVALARNQSRTLGLPTLPTVVLPHPIGGTTMDTIAPKLDAALSEILGKLTGPLAATAESSAMSAPPAQRIEIATDDEWGALQAAFGERGWSDGLPLVPPTEARVQAMLRYADRPASHVVGTLAPRMGAATVEVIAVNAVMAGCRPEHLPLLIAAVGAMAQRELNLYGLQTTTHCVAPLLVVNGPLAAPLGINAGSSLFGPGPWANGVVGRALRLLLLNVGGGTPIEIDKATMGHPGKYTFCIAENEAASPWPSLRTERGYAPDVSTVTLIGAEAPHNINDHESTTAGGLLTMIGGTMAQPGQNNIYYAGEPLVILSPEHAATIAAEGYTKDDVRRALHALARIPLSRLSRENIERRMYRKFPRQFRDRPLDTMVKAAQRWEDVMIVVAGGPGKHSMYVPTFGGTRAVSQPVLHADGRPYVAADFQS
jgi:hypothetical protein